MRRIQLKQVSYQNL
ncbi:hypothetical protein [Colwellia sp.]